MRHLVNKPELLAPGEVFCIRRHLAGCLVKHRRCNKFTKCQQCVRQKFLFENGPSKQIMNKVISVFELFFVKIYHDICGSFEKLIKNYLLLTLFCLQGRIKVKSIWNNNFCL